MTVKAIIFDCFGVLSVDPRTHTISKVAAPHRERLGELFNQSDYGYLTTQEFVQQAAELTGMTSESFYEENLGRYVRNDELLELIRHLKKAYKIGLLSNANDSVIDYLFTKDEAKELFDDILVSSQVGMVKPQLALFELAAVRLGCTAKECVMVDDLARNIEGAMQAGMQGVLFTSNEALANELKKVGVGA